MSVAAEVAVPPVDFLLERALTVDGTARITLETVVPLGPSPLQHVRIESERLPLLCDLVAADPTVDHLEVFHEGTDEWVLEIQWAEATNEFLDILRDTQAVCESAVAIDGMWHLSLWFRTHERLSDWYRESTRRDISVYVERLRDRGDVDTTAGLDRLTDAQRDALRVALEAGYFSVPRDVTLEGVADRLGISDTAASQRLRRGVRNVLGESLDFDDTRTRDVHSSPR